MRYTTTWLALTALVVVGATIPATAGAEPPAPNTTGTTLPTGDLVARGDYLVRIMACHDCHTPWTMTSAGPQPDMTRMLSGHPQHVAVQEPATLNETWEWAGAGTNTAFSGPWGISFTANLTPDRETGLGTWTADTFIAAIRTGRHEGQGRPILPPMPYPMYRQATDEDLRAVFAYLQSIPPIVNRVPLPVDPPEVR